MQITEENMDPSSSQSKMCSPKSYAQELKFNPPEDLVATPVEPPKKSPFKPDPKL